MEHERKIRVLVADDSFFIRTYLAELFSHELDMEVVGTASNGDDAVRLARELEPDVITMDYNMPGKNGIEAAAEIMLGARPLPAIIMLSAFSGEEGKRAWRKLEESGAYVVVKPSGEVSLDIERAAETIKEKIREAGRIEVRVRKLFEHLEHRKDALKKRSAAKSPSTEDGEPPSVVVIGASTGGPPLVEHLLSLFDAEDGLAFVVVQHMSTYFTKLFADRLDRVLGMPAHEIAPGEVIRPGEIYVVPGDMRLSVTKGGDGREHRAILHPARGEHREDAIDAAMTSLAAAYGERVAGVLLSGMGTDGTEGLRAISSARGLAVAQDPDTASVSSMPEHALREGAAIGSALLEDIPDTIRRFFAGQKRMP